MDLIAAVEAGDAERVRALVEKDPSLAGMEKDGIPAVRIALYHRRPAIRDLLLAADPPLDGLDHAALGDAEGLRTALATEDGLVERRSADGFTALHYACFFGGPEVTRLLLEHGANPNTPAENDSHVRPLHSAAAARDTASAELLLAAGADPDATQAGGFTALHAAAQHDDADLAAALLRAGADPAVRDEQGADAAAMARAKESVAVLTLLG